MSRYVLTFNKKGNMRFISHLDMQRLFRRVLNRADVALSFSQGFNPHPITNIVQPLSLGFEAECDYFEIETREKLLSSRLLSDLNQALPEGIKFINCREIPHEKRNLSSYCEYSHYKVFLPVTDLKEEDINNFLSQNTVNVLKRDKKTKKMVYKDIKSWIYSINGLIQIGDGYMLDMILRAAPNEVVNPLQLSESLLQFLKKDYLAEDIRITRLDLYYLEEGNLKSLYEREI